jgi:hypothetical protein
MILVHGRQEMIDLAGIETYPTKDTETSSKQNSYWMSSMHKTPSQALERHPSAKSSALRSLDEHKTHL